MSNLLNFLKFHKRTILTTILLLAFISSLFTINWNEDLIHSGGKETIFQIAKALFNPDFSKETITLALISSYKTLAYAAAGISLACIIGFVFGILASGILS